MQYLLTCCKWWRKKNPKTIKYRYVKYQI